jgi:uncharacterized protein HemX
MIEIAGQDPKKGAAQVGSQPITLAASALIIIVLGAGGMALWRSHAGTVPAPDRLIAPSQLQANTAQVSDELTEKTRALEATQQESIDQLQTLQDQLQTARRLLTVQQADTKRLSEQVSSLTEAIDTLRQSFASARAAEASTPSARRQSARTRSESSKTADRKHVN